MKRSAPLLAALMLSAPNAMAQQAGHVHPGPLVAQAGKEAAPGATAGRTAAVDTDALIKDALSAAPPLIERSAKVMDWDGKVLRDGVGDYTCLPTHPDKRASGGKEPMCLDRVWLEWGDAWMNKKPFKADAVGVAYMMSGDTGASNTDPFATQATRDNQWIVEGPHVMVIVPDAKALDGLSTDPHAGGAYVMWKGTPYAHIMVPVGKRPAQPGR
ncbi:MAG TPA: hypothetical protein VIL72_02990 [Beijerinckiaceae bacterium]